MANVSVIIGGGSGIGLETAKQMPKDRIIIISGRSEEKLMKGVETLRGLGYTAFAKVCDVAKRASVRDLVTFALGYGNIKNVIHTAGISTAERPEQILHINALGTVHVNKEFSEAMKEGSVIVDVACVKAYAVPPKKIPMRAYPFVDVDERMFMEKAMKVCNKAKDPAKILELAYGVSKHFVIWFAKKCAAEYAEKGIRVVSVSPKRIDNNQSAKQVGYALSTIADERNGCLGGVDVVLKN